MKKIDLTQGNVRKNLLYMSVPTMAGFFAQTFYDIVDMMWIGRLSMEALAGVTVFSAIFSMVFVLNEIIGTSSISLISQTYGTGDMKKTSTVIEQTITFKALVAILAGLILLVIFKPLALMIDKNPDVLKSVMDYGTIRLFFLPLMFTSFTVNTALRCIGDAKRPFYLMLLSSVINIILDPILMFDTLPLNLGFVKLTLPGAGLGVFGAALATVIAITVACLLGFYFLVSGKTDIKITLRGLLRLDKKIDYKLITIGLPTGVEVLNRNLSNLVIMWFIGRFGTVALAASGIGMRFTGLLIMPLIGLTMAGGTITGQNFGINQIDRAKDTAKEAAKLGFVFIAFFALITFTFDEQIMRLFTPDQAIIAMGVPMLRILVISMFFLAIMFGYSCVFSGSGYNMPFLVSSLAGRWTGIVFAAIAILIFKGNILWVWYSYLFGDLIEFFVIMYYYNQGDWQHKRVTD